MVARDNNGNEYDLRWECSSVILNYNIIGDTVKYVDFIDERFISRVGEKGYYVIPDVNHRGSGICSFVQKNDMERIYPQHLMPMFGVKNEGCCVMGIVLGSAAEFNIVFGVKNERYYLYLRFCFTEGKPYENIKIKIDELAQNMSYIDMAKHYREFQLNNKMCVPLCQRVKDNKYLEYAVKSPEIRIRLGWKEAPPKILEQTIQNEPEMKVACKFERVKDIIDELKKQGVDKAEICLIGWNISGHDGRYPQMFPVEEKLGGEQKLRELISYTKKMGYQIVCHTNSTDCYSISENFSYDIVAKKSDGSISINDLPWSGGRMYHLCPVKALQFAKRDLKRVRDLGFEGLHYIDVMSVVPLRWCHDNKHKVTPRETLKCYKRIMEISHKLFGGFASEGCFDFAVKYLDYGLYTACAEINDELIDMEIPLWELVYHGIVLYNPSTETVNCTIKSKRDLLKLLQYGGRPTFYFYSKFMNGLNTDWLGREDLICDTDEQLKQSVSKIKEAYDIYKKLYYLQYEFMDDYKKISSNVFETRYSDGTVVTVDYNTMSYMVR